jgi:hypothetical protein
MEWAAVVVAMQTGQVSRFFFFRRALHFGQLHIVSVHQ